MTYIPVYTKQFEKDLKRCKRRGKNLDKFKILASTLLSGNKQTIPALPIFPPLACGLLPPRNNQFT